ncbi:MAG: hypothetical protein E5W90_34170, partial [Mesorhizobium sp.]
MVFVRRPPWHDRHYAQARSQAITKSCTPKDVTQRPPDRTYQCALEERARNNPIGGEIMKTRSTVSAAFLAGAVATALASFATARKA